MKNNAEFAELKFIDKNNDDEDKELIYFLIIDLRDICISFIE